METGNKSEVAQLLRRIELEYEAAQRALRAGLWQRPPRIHHGEDGTHAAMPGATGSADRGARSNRTGRAITGGKARVSYAHGCAGHRQGVAPEALTEGCAGHRQGVAPEALTEASANGRQATTQGAGHAGRPPRREQATRKGWPYYIRPLHKRHGTIVESE